MADNYDDLFSVVTHYMQDLCAELRTALSLEDTRLRYGTWKNKRGMFASYISFFPHGDPAEDSVDAVISLDIKDRTLHFKADVSRSSGEMVVEISEHDISITPLDVSIGELQKASGFATQEFEKYFASLQPRSM